MPNNPRWTAGPWKVSWENRTVEDYDPEDAPCEIIGPDGGLIVSAADVFDARPEEETAANLDLIAAAPEMYEALEAALPFVIEATGPQSDTGIRLKIERALEKANPTRGTDAR